MGYYIKREHVERNLKLLQNIRDHLNRGEILTLTYENESPSRIEYKIRNVLKSAETYTEFGFSDLFDKVTLSVKGNSILVKPRYPGVTSYGDVVDESGALQQVINQSGTVGQIRFRPSPSYNEQAIREAVDSLGWIVDSIRSDGSDLIMVISRDEIQEPRSSRRDTAFDILDNADEVSSDSLIKKLEEEFGQ